MANLVKRLWSGADFWDKEENKRQRKQFAQQKQAQPQGAPSQSLGNKLRDIVDPNTQADKWRRQQAGQSQDYQAKGVNAFRSGLAKPLTEISDTILNAGRFGAANMTNNQAAKESATRQLKDSASQSLPGLLYKPAHEMTVNTLYKNPKSFVEGFQQGFKGDGSLLSKLSATHRAQQASAQRQGMTGDIIKDTVAPGIETGLNIASAGAAGFAGKQFGGQLVKQGVLPAVRTALPSLVKTAGLNAAQGAGMELYEDAPTIKGAVQKGAMGGALGTVGDLAFGAIPAVRAFNRAGGNAPALPRPAIPKLPQAKLVSGPLEDASLRELRHTKRELGKQWDRATPRTRKDIEKGIRAIDEQIRNVSQGGYVRLRSSASPETPQDRLVQQLLHQRNQQASLPAGGATTRIAGVDNSASIPGRPSSGVLSPVESSSVGLPPVVASSRANTTKGILETSPNTKTSLTETKTGQISFSPLDNNKPKQLTIKNSTAPFSNEQNKIVSDYADMLRSMGEGNGVSVASDGRRVSNNVRFGETKGNRMTKSAWQDEAERQLRSGQAEPEIQKAFRDLDDPEFRSLAQSEEASTARVTIGDKFETDPLEGFRQKIKQQSRENNIPVRKMVQDGDTITATNVNPNIKAREKSYSIDVDGNLMEDSNGAYKIFSDDDGRVKEVRIGKEVFSSKDFGDLSDVNGYGSTLATMRRNVERSFGKETGEKLNKFLVDHQQGQATRLIERQLALKNGLKDLTDGLGINFARGTKKAKEVSAAIQDYGEGVIAKQDLVARYGKDYAEKIVNADRWFKKQYDSLLTEMNSTLTKYGYDPVPKRKNYYTHFQDDSIWKKFGLKMQEISGVSGKSMMQETQPTGIRGSISNKLAGQSEFLEPNKRFNQFALRRKGDKHTADAFQSFERYLDPTLNNIYMTPSITRARVVAKAIAQDADIMGKDANKIIVQTREWANSLAGKSNRILDRTLADTNWGQKTLKATQWAQKQAGQNTIVGNLSTAVMQPIVLAQTTGKFGFKNTILGAMQELGSAHAKDAPIRQSAFMRRRYTDLSNVTQGKMDVTRNVMGKPLEVVEETAGRITWNAAHNDALSRGLKGKRAIQYADIETEKTLAGRSIGEKPEAFRSKSMGPFTMYQLEVNNFWQQFGKEMTKPQAARAMVAAFGLNMILQEVTGRQVGFNPIDAAIDSYHETQKEEKSAIDKTKDIGRRFAGELVDNTPFIGPGLNLAFGEIGTKWLGESSNTGRFGATSPIAAIANTTKVGGVSVPQNLLMPGGGSQVKKTYEGAQALLKGGIDDKSGDRLVDIPRTPENIAKGLMFGRGAIPEVGAYYDNLGRKKVDQRPVPNQLQSTAGSQSLDGLTKDQQEQYRDLPENARVDFLETARAKNKVDRKVEKETEAYKKQTSDGGTTRSDGKFIIKEGDEYKTYDSKAKYEESRAKKETDEKIQKFKDSKDKTTWINDRYYYKKKDGSVANKSKYEHDYDSGASKRKLEMDRAYEANNLDGYVDVASAEYDALEALKERFDPDTEQDKIDDITLKQENLRDKVEGYLEKGYTKKGGSGGTGKKPSVDLILKSITNQTPSTPRVAKMKSSAPRIPSMSTGVKTPRVSRPRNRMGVSSSKVRIS